MVLLAKAGVQTPNWPLLQRCFYDYMLLLHCLGCVNSCHYLIQFGEFFEFTKTITNFKVP